MIRREALIESRKDLGCSSIFMGVPAAAPCKNRNSSSSTKFTLVKTVLLKVLF